MALLVMPRATGTQATSRNLIVAPVPQKRLVPTIENRVSEVFTNTTIPCHNLLNALRIETFSRAWAGGSRGIRKLASAAAPYPGVAYRLLQDTPTRLVLLRRPAPPSPPLAAILDLVRELFGDAPDASKDAGQGLEATLVGT